MIFFENSPPICWFLKTQSCSRRLTWSRDFNACQLNLSNAQIQILCQNSSICKCLIVDCDDGLMWNTFTYYDYIRTNIMRLPLRFLFQVEPVDSDLLNKFTTVLREVAVRLSKKRTAQFKPSKHNPNHVYLTQFISSQLYTPFKQIQSTKSSKTIPTRLYSNTTQFKVNIADII